MDLWKIIFLFLIAWQAPIIIVRTLKAMGVIWWSFVLLAIGLTGFTYLQFLL